MDSDWVLDKDNLSSPEQFADLANAYLDSGILLCSEMSRGSFSATFSRGRVVLFLSLHSVELFLKGAILNGRLLQRETLTSFAIFKVPITSYIPKIIFVGSFPLEPNTWVSQHKRSKHCSKENDLWIRCTVIQSDREGNPWRGIIGFEAKDFLSKLENIKEDFCRLEKQIFALKGG